MSEPVWQILYTQDIEDFHTYNLKIYSRELSQSEDDWTDITNHCTSVNGRVITDLTRVDPPYAFKIAYGEISSEFIPYSPDYDFGDGSIVVEGRVSEAAVYGASATISLYTTKNDVIPSKSRLTLLESDDGANWSPVEVVTSTKLEDRTGSGAYYWVYTEPILRRYARLMYEGVHATTFRTMAQYKWRDIPAGQLEVEPLGVKREYLQPANITHYQIPFHIVQNSEGGGWKEIKPEDVGASIRTIWPEKESEFRRINDATYDVNTGRLDIGIPIEFTVGAYCEILMTIYQGDGGWVIPLPLSREHELIPNA